MWNVFTKKLKVDIDKKNNGLLSATAVEKIKNGVNVERLNNNPVKITDELITQILTK